MKASKVMGMAIALAVACVLAACGSHELGIEALDEVSGIRVTATNARADDEAISEGAITVADGDVIIVSPCLDEGSFNLTITRQGDGTAVYDEVAEGRIMFPIEAEPGTYDVKASGNGATGWMTVFAQSADEFEEQNDSLADALEGVNMDSSDVVGED